MGHVICANRRRNVIPRPLRNGSQSQKLIGSRNGFQMIFLLLQPSLTSAKDGFEFCWPVLASYQFFGPDTNFASPFFLFTNARDVAVGQY